MKVTADVQLVPLGIGVSLSPYIAACEKILAEAGLAPRLHAFGTNVEGEYDDLMAALKRCLEAVHGMGVPRISLALKLGTRTDRAQGLDDKLKSVQSKL